MKRIIASGLALGIGIAAVGCDIGNGGRSNPPEAGNAKVIVDVGAPLYPPAPVPKDSVSRSAVEPLVMHAQTNVIDKVEIPSQRDGKIMFLATEVNPGETIPAEDKVIHPISKEEYRVLRPGNRVAVNQLVMMLDDQEALAEYKIREAAITAAKADVEAGKATVETLEVVYERTKKLGGSSGGTGGTTDLEVRKAELDVKRAKSELAAKEALVVRSQEEFHKAKVNLEMYRIRSNISGVLLPTNRRPGEGVKAQEPVLQIHNTDKLRAEGLLEIGYRGRIREGMPVIVEPSVEVSEDLKIYGHAAPVSAVAIGGTLSNPVIVSASEDKTAKVWSRSGQLLKVLPHPVAVRSVACTPPSVKAALCVTGADDGKIRIWALSGAAAEPRVLEGTPHKGVITSVAFSADGNWVLTADARDICLWETASGKVKYLFPGQHLGEITNLTFLPQAKVMSCSRDNTVVIWNVGDKGASADVVLEGRTGDVSKVSVSPSGRYVLTDVGNTIRVMTLPERDTAGVLQSVADSYKFSAFALYSADGQFILTGTNTDGRLSVWRAPSASTRAAEVRQMVPKDRLASFTTAAVSPFEQLPFAVSGSKNGLIYVWPMPTEAETRDPIIGQITFIDTMADASTRKIRVWAEFNNTKAKLLPGGTVTLVAYPQTPARE